MNLQFISFLPEFFLFILALFWLFSNLNKSSFIGDKNTTSSSLLPKFAYYTFLFFNLGILLFLWTYSDQSNSKVYKNFSFGRLEMSAKFIILILGMPWLGLGSKGIFRSFQRENMKSLEYPSLLLFSMIGSFLMVSSSHLVPIFIAFSLQILPVFIAVFLYEDKVHSRIWVVRCFILEGICLSFFVFGSAIFYGISGDLSIKSISFLCQDFFHKGETDLGVMIGFFMILMIFLFRLAAFPFHSWMNGFHKSMSNLIVPFMLSFYFSAFIGLIRLLFEGFSGLNAIWQPVLFYVGFSSCLWGSIGGLFQNNVRSFFSYNYIFHLGIVFLGISSGTLDGLQSSLLHWVVYTVSVSTFFFFWSNLSANDQMLDNIDQARGLGISHPSFAFLIILVLLSLAGVPPFAGFWCELYILKNLVPSGWAYVSMLLILSIIVSFQYFHIIRAIYFSDRSGEIRVAYEWKTIWTLVPIMLIGFFLFQDAICDFLKKNIGNV